MNGEQPKIEIFEPFGAAFEVMKRILFQPFDFGKWCVIGFAAFLSGSWGSNFRFRFPMTGDWNFRSVTRSTTHNSIPTTESLPPWLIPLLIALAVLVFILIFVLMWVVSRGRFIFTDCVVKNRAAIAAPWKEYRREGNSFFLFSLVVTFVTLLLAGVVVLLIAVPLGLFAGEKGAGFGAAAILGLVFVGLIWLAFAIYLGVVSPLMVPVMYRRRCLARQALLDVSRLVMTRPGPFVLFVLFQIVLVLALVVVSTIVSCMTCCIAALPYVSSVVLLPAFVWLLAFKLLFLRQFGPDYDVWAAADSPVSASPPVPPSEPLPPTE